MEVSVNEVFRALASPLRLKVLRTLYNERKRASEIAHLLGASSEQLMYHLKQLKKAGLVEQIDEFYTLTDLGRRVYDLAAELEVSLKLAEHEPLILDGKGSSVPLRLYLQALHFGVYGSSAHSRIVSRLESYVEEIFGMGASIVPEVLALLILLSQLFKEGVIDAGRIEEVLVRRLRSRCKSSRALELLSSTRLYDFVVLKLASVHINPDSGLSLIYVPAQHIEYLRTLLRSDILMDEVMLGISDSGQRASEALNTLLAISRFLRTSIALHAEVLEGLIPELEKILEGSVHTHPLLVIRVRGSNELTTTALRFLTRAINRGVPVLFSFQELVPSAGMLAIEVGEDITVHLGACTVLVPGLVAKSRTLGREPGDLLRGLAPGILDLFKLSKRRASLWVSLVTAGSTGVSLNAHISLAGVEDAYVAVHKIRRKDEQFYAHQLVEWAQDILGKLEELTREELAREEVHASYTFFSPRETIAPEKSAGRWGVNNISPFILAKRSFEEIIALESSLHMAVNPAPSILEVRLREVSAVQLELTLRSLEKLGVKLFTVTKTNLAYCTDCGEIFGRELPRCPRCQSVKTDHLIRADLVYAPSADLLPGYFEEAEARCSADRYFASEIGS